MAAIEDYALIGDGETAALVARDGSIDWLCWPRFDSDACFAAILGTAEHGRWRLAPEADATITRRYRDDTLILETRFETAEGTVTVIDFMPPRGAASDVIRIVAGERGAVAMRMDLAIRFGYGAEIPWVTRAEDGALRAIAGPDKVVLRTPVALRGEGMTTVASFTVTAGERIPFVLTYDPSHRPDPAPVEAEDALADTEGFWTEWAGRGTAAGDHRATVVRSLITLKALIYAPTGGIVAAPTTSLPEQPGGSRNWDYRFCWVRDSTFTLLALMNSGYFEEAGAWRDWLLRAAAGSPEQMRIMYGIAGERRLTEWEVPWLPGHDGAAPVRVGNAAHGQLQLDVFGELLDTLHQARVGGLPASDDGWALESALLTHLETIWQEPDHGIWEMRGPPQRFTVSRMMAWVAFDRGIRSAEDFGLDGPLDRWRVVRDAIHAEVCRLGWDAAKGSFVQAYGTDALDASLLLMPAVGFLPAGDPRVAGTIAAVERELLRDGLVRRYDTHESDDGLPPGEAAFVACTLWLADAYVLQGRRQEAQALFDRVAALCNDVGLLAEEYDPRTRRMAGNFPQAFSHIALINTAHNLAGEKKPASQRYGRADGTAPS